jgi:hypothetical protein
MKNIFIVILFFLSVGSGSPVDSIRVNNLVAKVDSLSRQLEKSQYEAEATKEIYQKTNDRIDSKLTWILSWAGGIAIGVFGFMAIMGIINYTHAAREADSIVIRVRDEVKQEIQADINSINATDSMMRESIKSLEASVNGRTDITLKNVSTKFDEYSKSANELLETRFSKFIKESRIEMDHIRIIGQVEFYLREKRIDDSAKYLIEESNRRMGNAVILEWKEKLIEYANILANAIIPGYLENDKIMSEDMKNRYTQIAIRMEKMSLDDQARNIQEAVSRYQQAQLVGK